MIETANQESLTFLFSDVERSTKNWLVRSVEMTSHIPTINGVVERCSIKNDGVIFGREGDGRAVHFTSADDAVRASIEIQETLADDAVSGGLRVRIGLHSGTVFRLFDGQLGGTPLNVIGRMHRAGHGGQIVATPLTVQMSTEALSTTALVNLGSWSFQDFEPMQLFQVDWNSERFPPLRTQRRFEPPRPATTPFFGRTAQLQKLSSPSSNVVSTITGPGGIGKTRLVREVVAQCGHNYRDGVGFIDLQRLGAQGTVASAIATALSIETAHAESEVLGLAQALTGSKVLIVLDNCEHVLASAGVAAEALANTDGPTVLATSRMPLGCASESVHPLGPLADTDAETGDAASSLFLWAADQSRPGFPLDPSTSAQIATVCDRLGNMPLAIELAASRMSAIGIADLVQLVDGPSEVDPSLDGTMRSILEWSVLHLDPTARDVGAVLAHTFPSAALSQVVDCLDHPTDHVVNALDELIRSGLVQLNAPDGQARYQMLQPMRPVFDEAEGATAVARRLADAYATLAADLGPEVRAEKESHAVARLTYDYGNIAASVLYDAERHDLARAARTLIATHMYFFLRTHYEFYSWVDFVLNQDGQLDPSLRSELLGIASFRAIAVGDMSRASAYAAEADGLAADRDQRPINSRVTMMTVHGVHGDFGRANGEYAEGLRQCTERNDLYARSNLNVMASMGLTSQGLYDMAQGLAETALADAEEIANPSSVAWSLCALADAIGADDSRQSFKLLESAVEMSRSVSNRWVEGQALLNLTRAARITGQIDRARELCIDALALCQQQANLVRTRQGMREAFLILDELGRTDATGRLDPLMRGLDETVPAAPPDQERVGNLLGDAPARRVFEHGYEPPIRSEHEAVVAARTELMALDS